MNRPDMTREQLATALEDCIEQGGYLVIRFNHSQMRQLREAETLMVIDALKGQARPEAADADWLRGFKANQIHLTRDDHASNYCSAKEWIEEFVPDEFKDTPAETLRAMKESNTIWTLQIYPDTPVGFYIWHGATMEAVIAAARAHFDTRTPQGGVQK